MESMSDLLVSALEKREEHTQVEKPQRGSRRWQPGCGLDWPSPANCSVPSGGLFPSFIYPLTRLVTMKAHSSQSLASLKAAVNWASALSMLLAETQARPRRVHSWAVWLGGWEGGGRIAGTANRPGRSPAAQRPIASAQPACAGVLTQDSLEGGQDGLQSTILSFSSRKRTSLCASVPSLRSWLAWNASQSPRWWVCSLGNGWKRLAGLLDLRDQQDLFEHSVVMV